MATIKNRPERLEEKQWQKKCEAVDSYLAGRSLADVEFFVVHGYLSEVPIAGDPYTPCPTTWEEHKSFIRGRSEDELEFYVQHGYWPEATEEERRF